ncbi:hypothetical protein KAH43_01295, partial [Candidatus Bipolaricaulota bacterium]|nr:hypothetical protein [Candidatus Bipolaricaulota bacterium]
MKRQGLIVFLLLAVVWSVSATATTLVFFHEIGCSSCANTEAFLESIHPDYPDLEILHYEISEPESLEI